MKYIRRHGLVVGPGEGGLEHRAYSLIAYCAFTDPHQLFNRVLAPYVENLDMNQVNYGIGQGPLLSVQYIARS